MLVTKCESYSEEEQINEQRTESKKPCEQQRTENAFGMNFADSMSAPLHILNHQKSGYSLRSINSVFGMQNQLSEEDQRTKSS